MVSILKKYGILMVFLTIIILAYLIWVIISKQNIDKIPSRGFFVWSN
jgi:Na+-transporting methylmalonyl-CoA/oxaloacetate decarboxylase gamma subunit